MKNLVSERKARVAGENNSVEEIVPLEIEQPTVFLGMFAHSKTDSLTQDEVDRYLSLRCEDPTVNPLEYWKVHEKQFPVISSIAKDILSIPGSSVAVERIFNCGRDIIGLRRHSLVPETFSALMFAKSALK